MGQVKQCATAVAENKVRCIIDDYLKEKIFSTVIITVERNISRNIPSVLSKLGS